MGRRWTLAPAHDVTLAILTLAGAFFALEQTMVVPALPALQRDPK